MEMKIIFFGVLYCIGWNNAIKSTKLLIGLGEPNSPEEISRSVPYTNRWFIQKLDHFNPTDKRTWKQKYQVNSQYHKEDGPIFLMIGGENAISSLWMTTGAWIDYAKEFNALCFQLEHRYYGKSRPTDDLSSESLVHLSSEQALADLAQFIIDSKTKFNISSTAKWVVFGGSYAGSLAAWSRMKFPHLIHAAVSSSGPLLAKADFNEYYKIVENILNTYNPDCAVQIKLATKMLNDLIKSDQGNVNNNINNFKLCDPLEVNNKIDLWSLFANLASNFADIIQYYRSNRLGATSTNKPTLDSLCDIMTNKLILSPLDRYALVNEKILNFNSQNCTDYTFNNLVKTYKNVSWKSDAATGSRQWTYQMCTEFGFFQTSSQEESIFGKFPLDLFIKLCSSVYGESYDIDLLTRGINRSNMMYGQLDIKESRVIYVQGTVDPWHALGMTHTKIINTVAIYINGTAHCADMYPPSPSDPPQLNRVRTLIRAYLQEWLAVSDLVEPFSLDNINVQ
ncbi:putative serine protease K12H4.7 [Daktulosphaira vitifoliae]|uniref:putative serine protease K12H4.7 n=1 Tax=Daktulosphaira vitifoliae TaxID=58002 RepID=UPI0021AA5117|nr:putative serine protease K12H4.7 [Daktulosphaira vitifoliae]